MRDRSNPQRWPLTKLQDHPEQAALFGDVSDEELDQLAAHMQAHGQQHPVEILSDGTIIAGHQRVRAARKLGWQEIDVVIRRDLEEAGDAAVQGRLIADNLVRRHLSPLVRARCIRRLMLAESGGRSGVLTWKKKEELKHRIATLLHLTVRSVNRYLLALEAPIEVQRAFDQGAITLVAAGRVALLPKTEREAIARRLREGEEAKKVVTEFLQRRKSAAGGADQAFTRLVRALRRELPGLSAALEEIEARRLTRCQDVLRGAADVLAAMLARAGTEDARGPDTVS